MIDSLNTNITDTLLVHANTASEEVCIFAENDPHGFLMAALGMSIVFSALVLLFVIFNNTPVLFRQSFRQKLKDFFSFKKTYEEKEIPEAGIEKKEEITGEVNAAIAAAIYLYRSELHDYENTVLTIKKVSRTYSPWSSKIYGIRNTPK